MGQRLTRSSPSPKRTQPSLAAPLPPCPEGASLQLLPPGKASLCLHIPSAWAQLLPALTWEATNPWDSNPGNTCQRDTINPCPPTAWHPQLGAPPASAQPAGVALAPTLGVPSTHLPAPRGASAPARHMQEKTVPSESRAGGTGGTWHPWVTAHRFPRLGHRGTVGTQGT